PNRIICAVSFKRVNISGNLRRHLRQQFKIYLITLTKFLLAVFHKVRAVIYPNNGTVLFTIYIPLWMPRKKLLYINLMTVLCIKSVRIAGLVNDRTASESLYTVYTI